LTSDDIPVVESYRGIGVHDDQSRRRIDTVVKPEIDRVHAMRAPGELFAYAGDVANSPESRLFAAAKCEASWELAAAERRVRPDIDLERVRAQVAGLGVMRWRDPWRFASLLDVRGAPGEPDTAAKREHPLPLKRGVASPVDDA